MKKLGPVREKQNKILDRMSALDLEVKCDILLSIVSEEFIWSFALDGRAYSMNDIVPYMAFYLGTVEGYTRPYPYSYFLEKVTFMLLDASQRCYNPLTEERLYSWQRSLFPFSYNGSQKVIVNRYRSDEIKLGVGPVGSERLGFVGPEPERIREEMDRLIKWMNEEEEGMDPVIKAAIAQLWFLLICPFDDGNGTVAREIRELFLARSDNRVFDDVFRMRSCSMSNEVRTRITEYYDTLEQTVKGDGDITLWLLFFLDCFDKAISTTEMTIAKSLFWQAHKDVDLNKRQRKIINSLFDGFTRDLLTREEICDYYLEISQKDVRALIEKGLLKDNGESAKIRFSVVMDHPSQ